MRPLYSPQIPLSHPVLGDEEVAAVEQVLRAGQLAAGPEVRSFEAEFAAHCGARFGIAVNNGTTALELALRGLGIGPGDEVIVPSFTFIATANAVCMVGARPVFADIDPVTMCVSAATVAPLLSSATAAIIAVHLYGHPAPVDALAALCSKHGCALVEDSAQALGTRWRGRHVGTTGSAGVFSFYATKAVTTGEGGMLITNDPELSERLRMLRNHGAREVGMHLGVGTNARMSEIAAAIGRVQLRGLEARNEARRVHARAYDQALAGVVEHPRCAPDAVHAQHQYTIQVDDRPRLLAALERASVGYGLYYPRPCHMQPAFARERPSLPHTERAAARVVSLPVRHDLAEAERDTVIAAVRRGARE
ncbi:DegT/DnrJ/EryC1/StrS family aminotransferase [Enhygromyxa salina]|nr:DegT/DnrJ/EryC1/StrS family aminotransferase [Enhygromyxa salina]